MSRDTNNIFLHFLNKDTQEIFGIIAGKSSVSKVQKERLRRGLNAAILLCGAENYCVLPLGFWFESQFTRDLLLETADFSRHGYIRFSVREESLNEYIDKKREQYYDLLKNPDTEPLYFAFFEDRVFSDLLDINPILIDRETKIGRYCSDIWGKSHDLLIMQNSGELVPVYAHFGKHKEYRVIAQEFRDVVQDPEAPFVWSRVRNLFPKLNIFDTSQQKALRLYFEKNYYKAYLEEYKATILYGFYPVDKGMDFDLGFPDNSIANYSWFELFLNSLSLRDLLDISAPIIVQIKQKDAWGFLQHAFVSLCNKNAFLCDPATRAELIKNEIELNHYSDYVNEIGAMLRMSKDSIVTGLQSPRVDVLIMVATAEEENAIITQGKWEYKSSSDGYGYYLYKEGLSFALARSTGMGPINAATATEYFVKELAPKYISMAGFCAGKKGKVNLGDIVVPNKVYDYSCNGKQLSETDFLPELSLSELDPLWLQKIERMGNEWRESITALKPITYESQYKYFIDLLIQNGFSISMKDVKKGPDVPNLIEIIRDELNHNYLIQNSDTITATEEGKKRYNHDYYIQYADYTDPDLTIRIGALATGSVVQEWDAIFEKLAKQYDRKTYAIDMEGFSVTQVAKFQHTPCIIAKGVGDFASGNKAFDNRYLPYAVYSAFRFIVTFFNSLTGQERLNR